jgi:hypothetical protein
MYSMLRPKTPVRTLLIDIMVFISSRPSTPPIRLHKEVDSNASRYIYSSILLLLFFIITKLETTPQHQEDHFAAMLTKATVIALLLQATTALAGNAIVSNRCYYDVWIRSIDIVVNRYP